MSLFLVCAQGARKAEKGLEPLFVYCKVCRTRVGEMPLTQFSHSLPPLTLNLISVHLCILDPFPQEDACASARTCPTGLLAKSLPWKW